ncbi:hypothetical protein ACOZ4I_06345 [Haloarcula salina]
MVVDGGSTVLLWLVAAWFLASGLFLALLYASGERDRGRRTRPE